MPVSAPVDRKQLLDKLVAIRAEIDNLEIPDWPIVSDALGEASLAIGEAIQDVEVHREPRD